MKTFGAYVITIDTSARFDAFDTAALLVGSHSLRNVDTIAPTLRLSDVENDFDSNIDSDINSNNEPDIIVVSLNDLLQRYRLSLPN